MDDLAIIAHEQTNKTDYLCHCYNNNTDSISSIKSIQNEEIDTVWFNMKTELKLRNIHILIIMNNLPSF